tara:strand:- start:2149 stop:2379 length:231 start_codon:yes stop_codon:yes gene_type:complete
MLTEIKEQTNTISIKTMTLDPNFGTVDPADVFTSDEYVSDEEGTYFAGGEIAFNEYSPEDDDEDMYEPDVFEGMDD